MIGWSLIVAGVVSVCAALVALMVPSGWQKIDARVEETTSHEGLTRAQVVYAFGSRTMRGALDLRPDTFRGDIVTIEYDAFDPAKIRRASWTKRETVWYGLPAMWVLILTGAILVARHRDAVAAF